MLDILDWPQIYLRWVLTCAQEMVTEKNASYMCLVVFRVTVFNAGSDTVCEVLILTLKNSIIGFKKSKELEFVLLPILEKED